MRDSSRLESPAMVGPRRVGLDLPTTDLGGVFRLIAGSITTVNGVRACRYSCALCGETFEQTGAGGGTIKLLEHAETHARPAN